MPLEDPNTVSGEQALCFTAGKIAGRVPLGGDLVSFICSGFEAKQNYTKLRRMLFRELEHPGHDKEQQLYFAGKLIQTASFGAQRANFRRYYIDGNTSGPLETIDIMRVRKLPQNPDDIMFGFWR